MSGFSFFIVCSKCGLRSPMYPFLFQREDIFTLYLPAANISTEKFEIKEMKIESRNITEEKLLEISTSVSTDTLFVSFPVLSSSGVEFKPLMQCPACGKTYLKGTLGAPKQKIKKLSSSLQIIKATRSIALNSTALFILEIEGKSTLKIECTHEREINQHIFRWYLERIADLDLNIFVEDFINQLISIGSICSTPHIRPRYCQFDERLALT